MKRACRMESGRSLTMAFTSSGALKRARASCTQLLGLPVRLAISLTLQPRFWCIWPMLAAS